MTRWDRALQLQVLVGIEVGIEVGTKLGIIEGIALGIELGIELGIAEGLELGIELGIALGIDVGLPEGAAVGAETTATKADPEHVSWLEQPKRISTLSQTAEVLTYDRRDPKRQLLSFATS